LIFRGRFVRPFPAAFRPVPQGIGLFLRGDGWHSGRSEESFFLPQSSPLSKHRRMDGGVSLCQPAWLLFL
jgi:hypothetical protein